MHYICLEETHGMEFFLPLFPETFGLIHLCRHLYLHLPMSLSTFWSFISRAKFKLCIGFALLTLKLITVLHFASLELFRETVIHFGIFLRR